MKISGKLLFIIVFFSSYVLDAQVLPQVYPDRPFLTKTAFVVPAGSFGIETGFVYAKEKYTSQSVDYTSENITLAQTEFRYGVAENFEFRATGEFLINKTTQGNVETNLQGLRGLAIGAKVKLMNEKNATPDVALLANLNIPYGNENLRPDKFEPGVFLALNKNFNANINFGLSGGGAYSSSADNMLASYGTFLSVAITERINIFVEYFGTSQKSVAPQQFEHAGLTFLHLNNLKIDFSLGRRVKGEGSEWFGNLGIAVLILK